MQEPPRKPIGHPAFDDSGESLVDLLPTHLKDGVGKFERWIDENQATIGNLMQGELRLGSGEFVSDSGLPPASIARIILLNAMLELAPQSFDDATERADRLISKHFDFLCFVSEQWAAKFSRSVDAQPSKNPRVQAERTRRLYRKSDQWARPFLMKHGMPYLVDASAEFGAWASTWRLGDAEHAECIGIVATISIDAAVWRKAKKVPPRWYMFSLLARAAAPISDPGLAIPLPRQRDQSVSFPQWDSSVESKESYQQRARKAFEQQLQHQIDATETDARKRGAQRVPVKRDGDRHFRWFVRYQVLGESQSSIAREACVQRQTVYQALRDVSELVDVPLRVGERGRPRRDDLGATGNSKNRKAA